MAIGERIHLARRSAGLSQQAVADKVGVTKAAICKYEKGNNVPSSGVLLRLARALGVKIEFFLRSPHVREIQASFRPCLGLPDETKEKITGRIQEWLERYLEAEGLLAEDAPLAGTRFDWPEGFPQDVAQLEDATRAADVLRDAWRLGRDPIENLTALLEERGIKAGLVEAPASCDAGGLWAVTDHGSVPVIAVRDGVPGDRQRFSLAHELGHLLLRCPPEQGENWVSKAANRFAAALLVPAEAVRAELGNRRRNISLYELHMLKHRYGASMQVWLYRAKDLEILSKEDAARLLRPFEAGEPYHVMEPGDQIPPERPARLERLVMRALSEEVIAERRASELLGRPFRQFKQEVEKEHRGLPLVACS